MHDAENRLRRTVVVRYLHGHAPGPCDRVDKKPCRHPGGDSDLARLQYDVACPGPALELALRGLRLERHALAPLIADPEQPFDELQPCAKSGVAAKPLTKQNQFVAVTECLWPDSQIRSPAAPAALASARFTCPSATSPGSFPSRPASANPWEWRSSVPSSAAIAETGSMPRRLPSAAPTQAQPEKSVPQPAPSPSRS